MITNISGVYLADLTFISDGNASVHKGLINWKKRVLQGNVVEKLKTFQTSGIIYIY